MERGLYELRGMEAVMHLDLSQHEASFLEQELSHHIRHVENELAHTDKHELQHALARDLEELRAILARLHGGMERNGAPEPV